LDVEHGRFTNGEAGASVPAFRLLIPPQGE